MPKTAVLERDEKLFRCWSHGYGLGATTKAMSENGTPMSKDEIQAAFARLAERYG